MAKLKLKIVLDCKHKYDFSGNLADALKDTSGLNCKKCGVRRTVTSRSVTYA